MSTGGVENERKRTLFSNKTNRDKTNSNLKANLVSLQASSSKSDLSYSYYINYLKINMEIAITERVPIETYYNLNIWHLFGHKTGLMASLHLEMFLVLVKKMFDLT